MLYMRRFILHITPIEGLIVDAGYTATATPSDVGGAEEPV